VGGFLLILELLLALEGLDEGLLGKVLSIRDIPYNSVYLDKDPPHVVGDKAVLLFQQL